MQSFAFYHLPDTEDVVFVEGNTTRSSLNLSAFKDECGFLIAPFNADEETPYVLLDTTDAQRFPLNFPELQSHLEQLIGKDDSNCVVPSARDGASEPAKSIADYRDAYHESFTKVMEALQSGECEKVVLSHAISSALPDTPSKDSNAFNAGCINLFLNACIHHTDRYVALWHTPQTGTWLTATPELLLAGSSPHWTTMALAGTKKSQSADLWSCKENDEHEYVVNHIREKLTPLTSACTSLPREEKTAGNVTHLLTRFSFVTRPCVATTDILSALHPTPAVCGTPCDSALSVIQRSEQSPRRYYTGYSGVIGNTSQLFVTLRCAQITPTTTILFGGGGCLRGSEESLEWEETLQKMETVRALLPSAETPHA